MNPRKLIFPNDELKHDSIIEWWYFNGHLHDQAGNRYAFMDCLFKAKTKAVKIPLISNIPIKIIYFSHAILTDLAKQNFVSTISPLSIISKDSWTRPLLFVNYTNQLLISGYINSVIEQLDNNRYHLKTENFDLSLVSLKSPLLEGGNGFLEVGSGKSTYYYSLTNLQTDGLIKIDNQWLKVSGQAWMDHQWADVSYTKDTWTWFSIQLNNQAELVCFEYIDGKSKTYLASISLPDNRQLHFTDFKITPLNQTWKSSKTKNIYQLSWRLEIPEQKIDLTVKPLIENQEIIFGNINYWEGPLSVEGIFNGQPVAGFLELVGRPSQLINKQEILKRLNLNLI